jgi:SAM-dependent methyltransferase
VALLRRKARGAGRRADVVQAPAEDLPFEDESFDAVLSTFGVMFTPSHPKAAFEMVQVCRPGGRIGMANWTPDGFIGRLFKTLGKHLPPAAGVVSPAQWGDERRLNDLFGDYATDILATRKMFNFRYRSAAHFIEVFRTWYGPVHKAFAALPPEAAKALEQDMTELLDGMNRGGSAGLVVPSEYLEVVIIRR